MIVRSRLTRRRLRVGFLVVIVVSVAVLAYGAGTGTTTSSAADVPRPEPRDGHTVITESGRAGTIIGYEPDGSLLYYNDSRTKYFDVDPVEGESLTVEYTATDTIHTSGPTCENPPCARNVIERTNLSTGETEVIYERYDHKETAGEWHDHVRINETHVLIADIVADQVFVVNVETGIVEWLWDAQGEFPLEGGGSYPGDWAHINDVSVLEDGRMMVSLRNQDQVVFIDPETGVQEEWTLGSEDDYDVMFEQHNPDYIPESEGGPAVVLADSENGRVEEFQRVDGEWERTWEWSDARMQWPRDADRLPNGHTLIADTHGKRVFEVNPGGEIVWEVATTLPYDAERLETGDESAGGQSAADLGLESRTGGDAADGGGFSVVGAVGGVIGAVLPHRVVNAVLYVTPAWMGASEFSAGGAGLLAGVAWGGLELRWRLGRVGIGLRSPLYRREQE
jgi:hypothetical protein